MNKKLYVVSGANGNLGSLVMEKLLEAGENVMGLCRNPDEASIKEYMVKNDDFLDNIDDIMKENHVCFIHLAFARANRSAEEIADSLNFTKRLLSSIADKPELERFICISSQGVYGKTGKIRTVSLPAAPGSVYTAAKYAEEILTEFAFEKRNDVDWCILRLDNVIQSQNLVRMLSKSALTTGEISIRCGRQYFSYIDKEDAAEAIALCAVHEENYKRKIYNVGPDCMRISLSEVAELVKSAAAQTGREVTIDETPEGIELWAGMDSKEFMQEFDWRPKFSIEEMVVRVYMQMETELGAR